MIERGKNENKQKKKKERVGLGCRASSYIPAADTVLVRESTID